MTRHARKPAIIALLAGAALAAAVLGATGQFRTASAGVASVEQLERKIAAGQADAVTWFAYGDALSREKRFDHAAAAYQRSLDLDPDKPIARFNETLALAQANEPDQFFNYFARVTANDPKQAVDLLDRPELAPMHSDPRWDQAAAGARAQAAD